MVLTLLAVRARGFLLRGRGQRADLVDLGLAIRPAIGVEYVVVPDHGRSLRVRLLPGIPREVGLRLPEHETPVDHADVAPERDRQRAVERRAGAARPVF